MRKGKPMKILRLAALAALLAIAGPALAETTLRIGLAEDPDVLDPTLARTFGAFRTNVPGWIPRLTPRRRHRPAATW